LDKIIIGVLLLLLGIACSSILYFAAKQPVHENLIPGLFHISAVLLAVLGGAAINHFYWRKKEHYTREMKILEEKIESYLRFCKALAMFNAYTDLIQRTEKQGAKKEDPKEYQQRRVDALGDLNREMNYIKIFFKSEKVESALKEYRNLYDDIRKGTKPWDEDTFEQLLEKGWNIQKAIFEELKTEI